MPNQYTTVVPHHLSIPVTGVTPKTQRRIWQHGPARLSHATFLVALAIAESGNRPLTARGIRAMTALSVRQVRRAIAELRARRIIRVFDDDALPTVHGYTLNPDTAAWR